MHVNIIEHGLRKLLSKIYKAASRNKLTLMCSLLFLILVSVSFGLGSDLFDFPFSASVWGTASDWVMILVTTTTAIYIYRTLRSQQETQKILSRQINLEEAKFRLQIVPKFEADFIKPDDPEMYITSPSISLRLEEYGAQYLRVTLTDKSNYYVSESPPYERGMHKGYTYKVQLKLVDSAEREYANNASLDYFEPMYIEYQDVVGNTYIQQVVMLLRKDRPIVFAGEPEHQILSP